MPGLLKTLRARFSPVRRQLHVSAAAIAGPTVATPAALSPLDLLGRKPVNLDTPELQRFIGGKRILVTGAGGSIGSEICRQIMKFCPATLVILDRCENALFEIEQELVDRWIGADVRAIVADICDAPRVGQVFDAERVDVVFHAAAHKHVPMMEKNPGEAIKNNIFGTKTVADAALAAGVDAFVMISTDKAVNPTSVMGASKRVAEFYVQSLNGGLDTGLGPWALGLGEENAFATRPHSSPKAQGPRPKARTRFVAVRFGNVLGSSGSVIPIFQKQIAAGGPVKVTHAEMRRYFMTIPEASQLVMQAGAIGQGGEIFILDMGRPVKIIDLAHEMIRRSGLVVGEDIQIKITGMRPGEKLFEELANDSDAITPTNHAQIGVWQLPRIDDSAVRAMLQDLQDVMDAPRDTIVDALMRAVPEFAPPQRPAMTIAA